MIVLQRRERSWRGIWRHLEAAWVLATAAEKDFWLVICHEHELKHHEAALTKGYRNGTWSAGWPHLSNETRALFPGKIGTLTLGENFSPLITDLL